MVDWRGQRRAMRRRIQQPRVVVALVGCGKSKAQLLPGETLPARELYQPGLLFRWSLQLAEVRHGTNVHVVSALHKLVSLGQQLETYEKSMKHLAPEERDAWGEEVVAALGRTYPGKLLELHVYASKPYVLPLCAHLPRGWVLEEPMRGMEIGQRKGWLKKQLAPVSGRLEESARPTRQLRLFEEVRAGPAPWPHVDESRYFVSGSNHAGEIRGLAAVGCNVGFGADEVSKGGPHSPAELALYELAGRVGVDNDFGGYRLRVFGDMGAIREVGFGPGGPFIKAPIAHDEMVRRLELFCRVAYQLGSQFYAVAPDVVAHQQDSLARMVTYRRYVQAVHAMGANVIVPVVRGSLYTPTEFFELACLTLRIPPRDAVAGMPMKKGKGWKVADLAAFCADLPMVCPPRVHLLGLGPKSDLYAEALEAVRGCAPDVEVSCDSVRITALVGRSNGRGGAPRALTAARDALLAAGVEGTAKLKDAAIRTVWGEMERQKLAQAVEAGWYDGELVDGPAPNLETYMARLTSDACAR